MRHRRGNHSGATRIPQSRHAHRTVATPPPRCQDHRCLGEHIRLTARKKQMGAHPHRTHALGGIAFLPHRSARHQPPYAGDSAHASHYRRRWEAEGYLTEHVGGGSSRCCGMGGRVRSHRSRRRPVRWRSGPTCAQVNGLFACKGVGGVGVGRSGPECRWRRGWRGRRARPAASRPRCAWRGAAVSGSACQFRICSCLLGHCTRSVGNAPLLFGCSAT